jgi:hypothetical protein
VSFMGWPLKRDEREAYSAFAEKRNAILTQSPVNQPLL